MFSLMNIFFSLVFFSSKNEIKNEKKTKRKKKIEKKEEAHAVYFKSPPIIKKSHSLLHNRFVNLFLYLLANTYNFSIFSFGLLA